MPRRICLGDAHRHVAGDAGDLALHVHAPGRIGERDVLPRGEEAVAAALVHQRVVVEALRNLGPARLSHQFDVVDVGRSVRPLIGAGQRAQRLALVEPLAGHRLVLDIAVKRLQLGGDALPIVERILQRRRDIARGAAAGEVAADHDQFTVARAVVETGEFHGVDLSGPKKSGLSG